jgi:uncharacterized protein YjiS (DUF1127 family)
MSSGSLPSERIVAPSLPPATAGRTSRGIGQRLSSAVAACIRSMRDAATERMLTDLGEHQLRDVGLSHVDSGRSPQCTLENRMLYASLGISPARDVGCLPTGSANRRGMRAPAFRRAWHLLSLWRQRVRQRRALAMLDEHDLQDISLTRSDAEWEARKPFWRA